ARVSSRASPTAPVAPKMAMFQPSDMVVYSRNKKASLPEYPTGSIKKTLTCRVVNGVKSQLMQQRRRGGVIAHHIQGGPLAALKVVLPQLVTPPRTTRHFTQQRVIAAHIIHQMHQSFQRCLIQRSMKGNATKFRGGQQRIQRDLLRMADK